MDNLEQQGNQGNQGIHLDEHETCEVPIHVSRNILMVDLSYFVFYRYYSTFSWLKKFAKEDVTAENIMENKLFLEKYPKLFEKSLSDLVKMHRVSWTNVILVKDCSRESIWRNEFFGEYKGTRDCNNRQRNDVFNREIFNYTYTDLLPKLHAKYGFVQVGHPRLEADDIIAIIKTEICKVEEEMIKIIIITNDNDYVQLVDDRTLIKNLQGKEIKDRVGMSPSQYLKTKVIMGDKSDNIPSIMKKIGPKTAEKLALSDESLEALCVKEPQVRTQYALNKLLIDFTMIPTGLKDDFMRRLNLIHAI